MPIFQKSVLNSATQNESLVATRWANFQNFKAKIDAIRDFNEEIYQDGFLHDIFEECLGYTRKVTNPTSYNLDREQKNETNSKKADAAILIDKNSLKGKASNVSLQQTAHGTGAVKDKIVVGVIELKGQDTKNLDRIEAQAFEYHNENANSRYIIISNFDELRFYIDKKTAYEKFSLFNITYEEFKILHLLISYESISQNIPLKLKEKSATFEAQISKQLYRDFSSFRTHLFENIVHNNASIDKSTLLRITQKLCDRIVFILFAEDRGILVPNTIRAIREHFATQAFTDYPLYDIYKFYFDGINNGNDKLYIPKYNGGLFATDEQLNSLIIDNECLDMEAQKLSDYDFMSDISVNILGHIFEQSLTDLEDMEKSFSDINLAGALPETKKKINKRKKDGVFYTPEYITRYIVENTLGKLCSDKKSELDIKHIEAPKDSRKPTKKEQTTKENLAVYRDWLLNLKIIDPACGSGAFLNQALEFLIREHKSLQQNLAIMGDITAVYDIEVGILEHNLYGVDINEDAVEIARLSLWLRTAQKGRMLTNLSDKIVCANSLIIDSFDGKATNPSLKQTAHDTSVVGGMPFELDSFDVVIGNPPYVRQESIKDQKEALNQKYEVYSGTADLFVYFYELGIRLLKPNGLKGFICSNKFFRAKYGKNLRKYILEHTTIEEIADFNGVKVFEDATVDSAITIFRKAKANSDSSFKVVDIDLENYSLMKQSDLSISSFAFSNPAELKIKKKIEEIGTPLKEWDINIYRGITTGCNEAFIINEKQKNDFIEQNKNLVTLIKPILRGRVLDRFKSSTPQEYLIFIPWNYNLEDNEIIKNHLSNFKEILSIRPEVKTNRYNWYVMSRYGSAYSHAFDNPKIIYPEFSSSPLFSYDDNKSYLLDTSWFIDKGDKYLLACLNSKLIWHYLGSISSSLGNASLRMKKIFVEQIPIPKITEAEQQPFIELVDEILSAKEKIKKYHKHFDTLNAVDKIEITEEIEKLESLVINNENTIDTMVYKLYGLTSEEIEIVERN